MRKLLLALVLLGLGSGGWAWAQTGGSPSSPLFGTPAGGDLCGTLPNPTVCRVNGATPPSPSNLIFYNVGANYTYTQTAGVKIIHWRGCAGGGGGGGGGVQVSGTAISGGGAGGGGGCSERWFRPSDLTSPVNVTIGTGGAGGTAAAGGTATAGGTGTAGGATFIGSTTAAAYALASGGGGGQGGALNAATGGGGGGGNGANTTSNAVAQANSGAAWLWGHRRQLRFRWRVRSGRCGGNLSRVLPWGGRDVRSRGGQRRRHHRALHAMRFRRIRWRRHHGACGQ